MLPPLSWIPWYILELHNVRLTLWINSSTLSTYYVLWIFTRCYSEIIKMRSFFLRDSKEKTYFKGVQHSLTKDRLLLVMDEKEKALVISSPYVFSLSSFTLAHSFYCHFPNLYSYLYLIANLIFLSGYSSVL